MSFTTGNLGLVVINQPNIKGRLGKIYRTKINTKKLNMFSEYLFA